MRFCSDCATALEERIPTDDDRPRKICPSCDRIHYQNPVVVVGCLVERGDQTLLCRRAIEPALGRWTIPAGYLELGESLLTGARRETMEEACADVEITAPYGLFDLPHIGQTHALFRAQLAAPDYAAARRASKSDSSTTATFRGTSWLSRPCTAPSHCGSKTGETGGRTCIPPSWSDSARARALTPETTN